MTGRESRTATRGHRRLAYSHGASLPVRALWFLFVGWWLAGVWLAVAWVLLVTVVGAPVGIKLLNGLPKVLSLKERTLVPARARPGHAVRPEQPSLLVRAVYFVLVGWWLGAVWAAVAHAAALTIVGIPVGIWMYGKLPRVVSLYRY